MPAGPAAKLAAEAAQRATRSLASIVVGRASGFFGDDEMQASWRAATGAQHAARPFNDKRDHRRHGTCGCLPVLPAGRWCRAARDGAVGGKSLGSRAHMASASTATPPRTRDETPDGTLAFNPTHTHARKNILAQKCSVHVRLTQPLFSMRTQSSSTSRSF